MKWLGLVSLILSGPAAYAETVRVVSGEHADFSRLVVTLPQARNWTFGRTAQGYELALGANDQRYDVSQVFDLIPRDRLTGIHTDPETGHLQLTIGCACHAIPFSLDENTIVIDLHNGPAPATSSFEVSLQGDALPALQGKERPRPRARQNPRAQAYDWLSMPQAPINAAAPMVPVFAQTTTRPLQDALVQQLADGATRGVVDLALPPAGASGVMAQPFPDDAQVRLAPAPGLRIAGQADAMQPDGARCISDDQIDIAQWGTTTDVLTQLASARASLVGEFDTPNQEALSDHIRLYLFLGFGAEALALMAAMPPDHEDAPIWAAVASLTDADVTDGTAFDGMAQCDSFAALWALLAGPVQPNTTAVQRAFSALPAHLRTHLGPRVVERLLALGQAAAAQNIIAAMGRGATTADSATLLAHAALDLHDGAAEQAVAKAEMALAEGGITTPAALVALVNAQIAADQVIDPSVATALAAMQIEFANDVMAPDLAAAHQLALIGSGQYAAAMALDKTAVPAAFWAILATRGTDDDVLQFAFDPPAAEIPAANALVVAKRLQRMGFTDAAQGWRDRAGIVPADDTTLQPTAETASAPAAVLARDIVTVDDPRPDRWQQNWSAVAGHEDGPWSALAAQIAPAGTPAQTEPPLAAAGRLVDDSKVTRDLVGQLLQSTTPLAE
jgi:hypothetical protein